MSTAAAKERPPALLRPALVAGALLGVLFALVALLRYPASPAQTLLYYVALGLLALAAVVAFVGLRPASAAQDGAVWRLSITFGLLIGALWMVEMLAANVIAVGTGINQVVYEAATLAAFALPLVSGGLAAYRLRRVSSGIVVGFWSGLISGLIAFLTLMSIAYAFMATLQHDPQTLREYAHSGERTLSTFIVGDFLFASCAHLLLIGVLYGTALATVGALFGRALAAPSPKPGPAAPPSAQPE
jgi:hypothetical protein